MFSQAARHLRENTSLLFNNRPFHQLPLRKIVRLDNGLDFKVGKGRNGRRLPPLSHGFALNRRGTTDYQVVTLIARIVCSLKELRGKYQRASLIMR